MSSAELDDASFGRQYSESEVFDICLCIAQKIQAFYITGSTSKTPYNRSLEEIVAKEMAGELDDEGDSRPIIGYQIESADGCHDIPSCFFSFEVLSEAAANTWLALDKRRLHRAWVKVPVYEGDIEDPIFFNDEFV